MTRGDDGRCARGCGVGALRLVFVITGLGCGGAERRLVDLVTRLTTRGHVCSVLALHGREAFFSPPPEVETRFFECDLPHVPRVLRQLRRVVWLRQRLRELGPDAVVSYIDVANALTLLAVRGCRQPPVVVSERVFPGLHRIPLHIALLRRLMYSKAAAVVVPTHGIARWMRRIVDPDTVHVIPNPVIAPAKALAMQSPGRDPHLICAVGRLHYQKGFDVLIRAFAEVAKAHADLRLVVLGDGPERARLEEVARMLGVHDRVELPGTTATPEEILRCCALFVCSSRYEGFPNALAEAMALGCPVVSTDCPTGPSDLVRHGVNGLLVPPDDVPALAEAIATLMVEPRLRTNLGRRATEVVARFPEDVTLESWERVLSRVVQRRFGVSTPVVKPPDLIL